MSIYISGLSLPPKGEAYLINPDGVVYRYTPMDDGEDHILRRISANLIEVPPHGRLGDLDALRTEFPMPSNWNNANEVLCHITGIWAEIDNAPTIIPADKEDT